MDEPARPEFIPHDTSTEAYWAQIGAYRKMGGAGRLAVMFRLMDVGRRLALAGIRSRHPEYDEQAVLRAYARLTLGDELVRRVWPGEPLVEP